MALSASSIYKTIWSFIASKPNRGEISPETFSHKSCNWTKMLLLLLLHHLHAASFALRSPIICHDVVGNFHRFEGLLTTGGPGHRVFPERKSRRSRKAVRRKAVSGRNIDSLAHELLISFI